MRALQVHDPIGPEGVAVAEVSEPEAGDAVLVDVVAAGVSFPDLLLSRGEYQVKPDPPFTLGIEAAGTVAQAPAGSGFEPGDRVAAFGLGACAERMVAPASGTFPLPEELSFEQGAGLVMNYHTAHFALGRRARLRSGETVLVQGAAGGVGTAAIQVAKGMGARVIGVCSTEEKADVAREAGADETVSSAGDWRAAVKDLTDGAGVDVVYDPVGGERTSESLRCLAEEGRLVVIGFTEGAIPQLALNRVLFRNVDVVGAAWGNFVSSRPELAGRIAEDLARMAAAGFVRPIVGERYTLEDGADALRALAERRATGKLVLQVSDAA